MDDKRDTGCCDGRRPRDWAGNFKSFSLLWGAPAAAMLIAVILPSAARTLVWVAALVWMGIACLLNARRCGRIHCRFTGPFFIVMAALVAAYDAGHIPLGDHGWTMLGAATVLGNAAIWWGSEKLLGRFQFHV